MRRRMLVEAGLVEGSRTSSTFFGGGNAVDEFKDAARLGEPFILPVQLSQPCPTDADVAKMCQVVLESKA